MNKEACSIMMTTMYAARMARKDLLRCVGRLATNLTKWTSVEDEKLYRMVCYISDSLKYREVGFIGDPPEKLYLGLYVDADFAGDRSDMKSTSDIFLALMAPHTFFPLNGISKKQTAQSHSTPEAEIVAAGRTCAGPVGGHFGQATYSSTLRRQ